MRRLRRKLQKMALPKQSSIPKSKLMMETLESRVLLSAVESLRVTEIMYNPIEMTGDTYGALNEWVEAGLLLVAVALLAG